MQRNARGTEPDCRVRSSAGSAVTVIDGIWVVATTSTGVSPPALLPRANGTEAGASFPVDISQQDGPACGPRVLTGGICVPIMAHWRVCFSIARIPNAHEASAAAGIASRSIDSAELTSLKVHVMFLEWIILGGTLTACDGNHSCS
jgi:hypothetical protein